MKSNRNWSAYELNQLLAHNKSITHLEKYGDTPVEYITGYAQFCNLDFLVTPDVLIPRLETEELVDRVAMDIKTKFQPSQSVEILDLGTGSGCIGLSLFNLLKQRFSSLSLVMSDNSVEALKVAQINLDRLIAPELQKSIQLLQSDLLTQIPDSIKIDVLVANLPYISDEYMQQLSPTVKSHEPETALRGGGSKGLGLINQLLDQVPRLLYLPKSIWLELDEYVQLKDLATPPDYRASIYRDQFEKVRFVLLDRV